MKFKIHKLSSLPDNIKWTEKEFESWKKTYYRHLLKIDIPNGSPLIKYFASTFFRDAILRKIEFDWKNRKLGIEIVREEADLQDLNEFNKGKKLRKIEISEYADDPLIYRFDFNDVDPVELKSNADHTGDFTILDTEIRKSADKFKMIIAQDADSCLSFDFQRCKFYLKNSLSVKRHTNGFRENMPYCAYCKDNLLTKKKIENIINTGKRKGNAGA